MTFAPVTVNPLHALDQLARALETSAAHDSAATRERAKERVARWRRVLSGLLDGTLEVGSRTPVAGAPAWATLEVVKGGFATGGLLAGGPLLDHERERAASLGITRDAEARVALNLYFVGDEGRRELLARLDDGRYRVDVPEEGALLVLAWLLEHDEGSAAAALFDEIAPFFDRLRFYPAPSERPPRPSSVVRLQTVGEVLAQLDALRPPDQILRMNEALTVWAPLYDRAVSLLLETVDGPPPAFARAPDGALARRPDGHPIVEGGWPLLVFPEGFAERARAFVDDCARARAEHRLCGKPDKPKESFAILRGALERCAAGPSTPTRRDQGAVRRVLASFLTRHGAPGSEKHRRLREEQAAIAARPLHASLARAVKERLRALPLDGGVPAVEPLLEPVRGDEAARLELPVGAALPPALAPKVARCLEATLDELVAAGVIKSGETVARVLPQVTSDLRASGLAAPELRRLYAAVYQAFRRRRSLLLLNLEHQVQLEELPWVSALEVRREAGTSERAAAREALEQVVALVLRSFPWTILPNKLLQELRSLSKAAGLDLPLTDELAADIFMGAFSSKFLEAAKRAARLMDGTLYARYYALPTERVLRLDDVKQRKGHAASSSPGFAALCAERAGEPLGGWGRVAANGKIIEQQQVLTTQNLAIVFDGLSVRAALEPELDELARRCFAWCCRQLEVRPAHFRAQLQTIKNVAYAWRQMVFFLSFLPSSEHNAFLGWAEGHLAGQRGRAPARFEPALRGLAAIVRGRAFDASGATDDGGRRLLGWTTERHWLAEELPARR